MLPADPDMLASYLNMKLRDQYASLDALCDDLELNKDEIVQKLKDADYDYIPARNQFLCTEAGKRGRPRRVDKNAGRGYILFMVR